MLKRLSDIPAGVVGFEAVGTFDDDDFEDTVEPVLRDEIAAGRPIRLLYVLGAEMKEYEGEALAAQMKFSARHFSSFERVAVASDQDWLRPALRVVSALVPGQLRAFPIAELPDAKRWLAEPSAQRG